MLEWFHNMRCIELKEMLRVRNLGFLFRTATNFSYSTDSVIASTSQDKNPQNFRRKMGKEKHQKQNKPKPEEQTAKATEGGAKKQTRLGLDVAKSENYSEWYSQVDP